MSINDIINILSNNLNTAFWTAVSFVTSWLMAHMYYKKSKTKKSLVYSYDSVGLYSFQWNDEVDVNITYNNLPILDPRYITIYIWNDGNEIIEGGDISNFDPIYCVIGGKIISIGRILSTRQSVQPKIDVHPAGEMLSLSFDFMEPKDGISFEVLLDTNDKSRPYIIPKFRGTIKGLQSGI